MDIYSSAHEQGMICAGPVRENRCPITEKERFAHWIRRSDAGILSGVNTGAAEWESKNMHTVGEEFGFLIIFGCIKRKTILSNVIDG